jgi:prepilin-type processing-associated H-X9-DG protein
MRTRGFTLVEVIVIISLIMFLIAMLLPAFSQSRESARVVLCNSKLGQLHTAHVVYVVANGGQNYPYRNDAIYMSFLEEFHQYQDELRFCPDAPTANQGWGSATKGWRYGTFTGVKYGSYGVNGFMYHPYHSPTGPGQGGNGYFGHADYHANGYPDFWYATLEDGQPSKAPLYADSEWVDGWPMEWDTVPPDFAGGWGAGADGTQMSRFCIDRHQMHINIVFADGHAATHRLDELWTLHWHRAWRGPSSPITIP